jgi:hypothetical protein
LKNQTPRRKTQNRTNPRKLQSNPAHFQECYVIPEALEVLVIRRLGRGIHAESGEIVELTSGKTGTERHADEGGQERKRERLTGASPITAAAEQAGCSVHFSTDT